MNKNLILQIKIKIKFGTQRQFAQACGKTDDWISRILGGILIPKEKEKAVMARELGLSIKELEDYLWPLKTREYPSIQGSPLVEIEKGGNEKLEPGNQTGK